MTDRNRELPSWMKKKEEKERVKGPLKRTRRPKVARSVFYCMNERELVEAAVSYLVNCSRGGLRSEHQTEPRPAAVTEDEEEKTPHAAAEASSGESDAQDRSYVSESDLDIAEAETLPYAVKEDTEADRGRGAQDKEEKLDLNTDGAGEKDDDALQLVREIFFS